MTLEELNKSIQTQKVHLTKGEKIEYWLNFILLLIPVFFFGQAFLHSVFSFVDFPILSILLFGLLIIHKLTNIYFKVYNLPLNGAQFKHANKAAALLSNWQILADNEDRFEAIKSSNWHWDGIRITAINKNGKLYLNSMVEPSFRANPITFQSNRRNIRLLLSQYQNVLRGDDVITLANNESTKREEEFWHE